MRTKRLNFILGVFGIWTLLLVFSCTSICFIKGDEYIRNAVVQRKDNIVVKNHRGKIYDRNSIPLVESHTDTMRLDENGVMNKNDGTEIVPLPVRYSYDSVARHLVGYLDSEGRGVYGLEKCFDSVLTGIGKDSVNVVKTADGRIIEAMGMSFIDEEYECSSIVLTLDSHIQRIAENSLANHGVTGAVVILDTETFDILAMASAPNYDQNNIGKHILSDSGEFLNRCLMPYNAGSIFKIITFSSAVENAKLRSYYNCSGALHLGDLTFNCHKADGHGTVSWKDGFSKSCNGAFYTMGLDLGSDRILDTARRFGLGDTVLYGLDGLGESRGYIPQRGESHGDTLNLSIGQGDILLTPLQAANMVCIIANDGLCGRVDLVSGTRDVDGNTKNLLDGEKYRKVISPLASAYVKECMAQTVLSGTGRILCENPADISGKTGTAETGWLKNGQTLVHGWFCGFFPRENPKYAMAVLVENGGSGSESAAPIFGEIAEEIIKIYPLG